MSVDAKAKRTTYRAIVRRIEADLNDRRGLHVDGMDSDIRKQIRDAWYGIIADEIGKLFKQTD